MKRLLGIAGVVGTLVAFGCSSDQSQGKGGTGGGTFIPLDGNGANAGNAAINTPDGLRALTAEEAEALKNPATACQGWAAEPEGGPAVLEFQVDTTGSMTESTASTGNQSKWEVMQTALPEALAALPSTWAVGLSFFSRPRNCYQGVQAVPIAPMTPQQLTALDNAIQARGADGYTPTEAAYMFALGQLQNWNAPAGYAGNNRYVVLVTDGIPTVDRDGCTLGSGPQNTITAAEYTHLVDTVGTQTTATGIKTFVVGVPGSEDPQGAMYDPMYQLSMVAQAGGTQIAGCTPSSGTSNGTRVNPRGTYCHYDMTETTDFASGLVGTIGTIAGGIVSCDYTVPPAPAGQIIDPNRVNMVYDDGAGNSYLVLPNNSASCDRGWHFTDSTNSQITVCQITCDLVQNNPQARITLTFGCLTGTAVY
jgi:hypothetical protein